MQTHPDPWRRLVIPHPEYAVHGLNLSADTPAGHERTRERCIGKVDRNRIIDDASTPRGRNRPAIGTAIGIEPNIHLVEPTTEAPRWNSDPDTHRKPGFGLAGRPLADLIGRAGPGQKDVPMAAVRVLGDLGR